METKEHSLFTENQNPRLVYGTGIHIFDQEKLFQNTPKKKRSQIYLVVVCVTEQYYVSIFFTRLWSVRKPLLFDTQNPGISGFSTAHAYKYKTKRQAKMKRDMK